MSARRSVLVVVAVLAAPATASAFFSGSGTGSGTASSGTIGAPAGVTVPSIASGTVPISWNAAQFSPADATADSAITYTVERSEDGGSTWSAAGGTCAGSQTTTACSDSPADGSHVYRVVGHLHTWTATSTQSSAVSVDSTAPTVQSIVRADSSPTNAGTVHWTVTFSESVTGVGQSDFALAAGGVSGAAISGVTGSGSSYTVTADTGSGQGTLGLNLTDDDSIADSAGNKLGGTGTGNGDFTGELYTLDLVAPTVVSINRADTDPASAGTVHWTVTFSESVSGVDESDFALAALGLTGSQITGVTGSGATYTVTADTGTGVGTLGLNLTDDDSIADSVGNKLGGTGTGNGDFTGETYTVTGI